MELSIFSGILYLAANSSAGAGDWPQVRIEDSRPWCTLAQHLQTVVRTPLVSFVMILIWSFTKLFGLYRSIRSVTTEEFHLN